MGVAAGRRRARSVAVVVAVLALFAPLQPARAASVGPFPDTAWFLVATHVDLLGRFPDPGWRDRAGPLVDSHGPEALYRSVLGSEEYRTRVAPVTRLYRSYFLRFPDAGGLDHWIRMAQSGAPLGWISHQFAASAEFRGRYGHLDDGAFVDLVYRNVLGRAPDADGRAYWIGRLRAGLSRGDLMVGFSESAENRAETAGWVDITTIYLRMLRRPPDDVGFEYWSLRYDLVPDAAPLAADLLRSGEYRGRWGDAPFPSAPAPRLRIAVFGDSLMTESAEFLVPGLESSGLAEVRAYSWPGTAICNWFGVIESVRNSFDPHVVVLSFSGNTGVSCMQGRDPAAAYEQDARTASQIAGARGAWLSWVVPPSSRHIDARTGFPRRAYERVVAEQPARRNIVDGGVLISPGGVYADWLPCLAAEPCGSQGHNQVRAPDGVHFCPGSGHGPPGRACRVWSSGAWRYARTVADGSVGAWFALPQRI